VPPESASVPARVLRAQMPTMHERVDMAFFFESHAPGLGLGPVPAGFNSAP
jgi:hypothetical protein